MFSKNLSFYRRRNGLSKRELAERVGVTPQAITHYEAGTRTPNMQIIQAIASVLQVKVLDFLRFHDENLTFQHGEFRKNAKCNKGQQELVRDSVEDYFQRFFTVVEILGGEILPPAPQCHWLNLSESEEENAKKLRDHLRLAPDGPISGLIELLENKGILICLLDGDEHFFGINGTVNGRPYIAINKNMTAERIRSTIVHELAHIMFKWPDNMTEHAQENMATAISGAFLFPLADVLRELGVKRRGISKDMQGTCKEYGISLQMLAVRAKIANVIGDTAYQRFYKWLSIKGWRKNEPSRIAVEDATLLSQLVYRAVSEDEISPAKGAEILGVPVGKILEDCIFNLPQESAL